MKKSRLPRSFLVFVVVSRSVVHANSGVRVLPLAKALSSVSVCRRILGYACFPWHKALFQLKGVRFD